MAIIKKGSNYKKLNKKDKGQASIENLILIGGAVLIAVVIITILVSLSGQSRDSVSDQANNISSSKDVPLSPTIVSVSAKYLDCYLVNPEISKNKVGILDFSWKPISKDGTYKLIIENSNNEVIENSRYVVTYDNVIQDSENLNPNILNNLVVSNIPLSENSCGDTYYLSIEVFKNNQSKKSSRFSFRWDDSGEKTPSYYNNYFDGNKIYSFDELYPLAYRLDVNENYADVNGDLDFPNISNFIIKLKFKVDSLTESNTLLSYKYSGSTGYSGGSLHRSGFKLQILTSGHIVAVGGANSWWWGGWDEFSEPFQTEFKFPPSSDYYEIILFKDRKDFSACYYDEDRTLVCSEVWTWPYGGHVDPIYYSEDYNPKNVFGAANLGSLDSFDENFNGDIDYIEMYHYSPENVIAAKNNLPLDNHVFKLNLRS